MELRFDFFCYVVFVSAAGQWLDGLQCDGSDSGHPQHPGLLSAGPEGLTEPLDGTAQLKGCKVEMHYTPFTQESEHSLGIVIITLALLESEHVC